MCISFISLQCTSYATYYVFELATKPAVISLLNLQLQTPPSPRKVSKIGRGFIYGLGPAAVGGELLVSFQAKREGGAGLSLQATRVVKIGWQKKAPLCRIVQYIFQGHRR